MICTLIQPKNVENFLKSWKLPTKIIKDVSLLKDAIRHLKTGEWNHYHLYKLGKELSISAVRVHAIVNQLEEDQLVEQIKRQYENLPIHTKSDIVINGHDLITLVQRKPGPWINETLSHIEKEMILGDLENSEKAIKEWLQSCSQL